MLNRNDYINWLALTSHEFFHVWNVRRLRPQALNQYDYDRETYTRELWLAEGLSSYYDNLLLFRSGLITVDEYLALLAEEIRSYEISPGRKVRSAEQASFDTWTKHYKPDANSINSDVSYYRKGSLIGFVADTAIRKASKQKVTLDDILREMYGLYGPDGSQSSGYPPRAFEALVEQTVGKPVADQIETLLTSLTDPDVDAALEYYGLQLERSATRKAAEAAGSPVPADFGLVWNSQESLLLVESVVRGGSGADAGVLPADELLAINGQRVNRLNIQDRMLRLQPDETAELLLVRNGQILTLSVKVQHAIADKYRISIRPNIKQREKNRMEQWLGMQLMFIKN
ncbi:MAG: PDZ domain-containing protein [Xanthomonadales bacterium]|nr:PDZ domain-containing protein [Xanthomonadales bacterium]